MDAEQHAAVKVPVAPGTPTIEYRRLLKSLREDRHSAARHLDVARFLVRVEHYHRALSSLRLAKALQPRRKETYLLLGWVYQKVGNVPQAVIAYQQLLRFDKSSVAGHFRLGSIFLEQDKFAEATRHLKRVVELVPTTRRAIRLLAAIAEKTGDPNRAMSHLEHLATLDNKNAQVYVDMGRIHRNAGRPDRAIIALRKALELKSELLSGRVELAGLLLEESAPDQALEVVNKGLATDSQNIELRLQEGYAQEALGSHERALTAFVTASRIAPEDFRPHLALGKVYTTKGDFDLAEDELKKALSLTARDKDVYRALSFLYLKSGKAEKAEHILMEMTEVFHQSPEAWRLLGELRERIKKLDEACDAFTKAIELAPADASLFCARARVHVKRGAYDEAVAGFQRARELDPDCEEARAETELIRGHKNYREALNALELAESAREKGDFEGARRHFEKILKLVPNNARWLDEHARLSIVCGDNKGAIESLERLLTMDHNTGRTALRLGKLFSALNSFEEAWRNFERCVNEEPFNVPARIRIIRTLGHRAISRNLSPDKFPRIEAAYRAGLNEPAKLSLAHLELAYLYLSFGSQIFPAKEWQEKARTHFAAVGEKCSEEILRYRYLGEFDLARRLGQDDTAIAAMVRLCELLPSSETYALALLEYLKAVGSYARGFRLAEQFSHRFSTNGLIKALDFEFFVQLANSRDNPKAFCRKRIQELQRAVATNADDGPSFLSLGLALQILSPAGERFESGRKVTVALNKARSLEADNPWPLWALLREQLRHLDGKQRRMDDGVTGQASTICRNGLRLFPDFSPFLEHLGRTLLSSSDPVDVDRGRSLLERAIIADEECAGALFTLGRHYESLGDTVAARQYYTKVLESPRGTFYAKKVIERLSRMVA